MTQPLVSIISVNYNGVAITLEMLRSMEGMSYANVEIIVVDNGSKEDPSPIVQQFPQVKLIRSLKKSIEIIKEEGLENTWLRHERLAMATREAVQALGLELFTKENWSNVLTAVKVPETINGIKLIEIMKNKYGVIIAGGQAHLKGKIFRIGHLGFISDFDIIIVISALERALVDLGMNIKIGSGVTRVQEVFTDY